MYCNLPAFMFNNFTTLKATKFIFCVLFLNSFRDLILLTTVMRNQGPHYQFKYKIDYENNYLNTSISYSEIRFTIKVPLTVNYSSIQKDNITESIENIRLVETKKFDEIE